MPEAIDWKTLLANLVKTFGPLLVEIILDLLQQAPPAAVAAFDWRALLTQLLQAILALLNPPAPAIA
jgi:hydroxyacyl-ACP dehydratase HTD2-like protein with hotdog domain